MMLGMWADKVLNDEPEFVAARSVKVAAAAMAGQSRFLRMQPSAYLQSDLASAGYRVNRRGVPSRSAR